MLSCLLSTSLGTTQLFSYILFVQPLPSRMTSHYPFFFHGTSHSTTWFIINIYRHHIAFRIHGECVAHSTRPSRYVIRKRGYDLTNHDQLASILRNKSCLFISCAWSLANQRPCLGTIFRPSIVIIRLLLLKPLMNNVDIIKISANRWNFGGEAARLLAML